MQILKISILFLIILPIQFFAQTQENSEIKEQLLDFNHKYQTAFFASYNNFENIKQEGELTLDFKAGEKEKIVNDEYFYVEYSASKTMKLNDLKNEILLRISEVAQRGMLMDTEGNETKIFCDPQYQDKASFQWSGRVVANKKTNTVELYIYKPSKKA